MPFASDEPLEIGTDCGSPVTRDYSTAVFSGEVRWVEIDLPDDGRDCEADISDEERINAALVKE